MLTKSTMPPPNFIRSRSLSFLSFSINNLLLWGLCFGPLRFLNNLFDVWTTIFSLFEWYGLKIHCLLDDVF